MTTTFSIQGTDIYAMTVSKLRDADFAVCQHCGERIDDPQLGVAVLSHKVEAAHPARVRYWRFC